MQHAGAQQGRDERTLRPNRAATAAGGEPAVSDDDVVAVAGHGEDLSAVAQAALEVEDSVAHEEAARGTAGAIATLLFRPDAAPHPFAVEDFSPITAADENFAWIDMSEYQEAQLHEVGALAGLHPAAIQAAAGGWRRPSLQRFRDHYYVSVTVPRLDTAATRVHAGQLDLFFGHNFLVSAHKLALPFADRLASRARQSPELVQLDSAYMLYLILDELLRYYEDQGERMEDDIEAMEQRALADPSEQFLADLLQLKRYVFALGRLAEQHREVFAAFLQPDFPFVSGDRVEPYFHDLRGRFDRLSQAFAGAKESVNGAFNIYVSHMSHRTNQIIKVLTIASILALPTTVILAFFGTSFDQLPLYTPVAFGLMLVLIPLVTGGILVAFRRNGWLS
jgi:magnesium transporter